MKETVYLVMDVGGVRRMAKKPPKLAGNERSVAIDISVDDAIFDYTFMKSSLVINEEDVQTPDLEIEVAHIAKEL